MPDEHENENPIDFLFEQLQIRKSDLSNEKDIRSQSMGVSKSNSQGLLKVIAASNSSRNLIISNK